MGYELLSEPIRRYIRDKRWESLRPIQAAAIVKILQTEQNYILASRTASGKTEAAFLPILSKVNFSENGVQVLYISPLIALINDQFQRVEDLCKYLDVSVTKWHGEASKSAKDRLIKSPGGILLITPESIEAMLTNHPYNAKALFYNLKFVIVDEIHTFLGSDRGLHLKSLLSRIIGLSKDVKFRSIGLSATIGDYEEAKRYFGDVTNTKVLLDRTSKEIDAYFKYVSNSQESFSPEFINELYEQTKDNKVLIFPNSRGRAEEIAVKLKKEAERKKGHNFYFSHHSSVDKELREYIEDFAKNNKRQSFCIACTSTLELGIDIGSVDMVVQIDATNSIASLIQRVGRSGRKEGLKSNLLLYATSPWKLLQSFACWELYNEGYVEPVYNQAKPFDLLFHQILSLLKETSGLSKEKLIERIKVNYAFTGFDNAEVEYLINYMIHADYIEDLKRELIVGFVGERLTNSKDFYSVFSTDPMFKVLHAGKPVGEIPFSPMVQEDENIMLAARVWKIKDVDNKSSKIFVEPAKDGKKPLFFGEGGEIHPRIREKMLNLLYSEISDEEADDSAIDCLNEMKLVFKTIPIEDLLYDRPYLIKEKGLEIYTFSGTRINRTIGYLLKSLGLDCYILEDQSLIEIKEDISVNVLISQLTNQLINIEGCISADMMENENAFKLNKWGQYLPVELKKRYVLDTYFDIEGTANFVSNVRFITNGLN